MVDTDTVLEYGHFTNLVRNGIRHIHQISCDFWHHCCGGDENSRRLEREYKIVVKEAEKYFQSKENRKMFWNTIADRYGENDLTRSQKLCLSSIISIYLAQGEAELGWIQREIRLTPNHSDELSKKIHGYYIKSPTFLRAAFHKIFKGKSDMSRIRYEMFLDMMASIIHISILGRFMNTEKIKMGSVSSRLDHYSENNHLIWLSSFLFSCTAISYYTVKSEKSFRDGCGEIYNHYNIMTWKPELAELSKTLSALNKLFERLHVNIESSSKFRVNRKIKQTIKIEYAAMKKVHKHINQQLAH